MNNKIYDSVLITLIMLSVFFIMYHLGYEMSERKNCILSKGHYSFDYGECIRGGENERSR